MKTVLAARASAILYRVALASPPGIFLLPANICPIVPLTFILAERPIEYLDIDPKTLAMSPELLVRRLLDASQPRVTMVVYVRTYGAVHDVSDLFADLQELGPMVIDDRCLSRPEPDLGALDSQGADAVLFSTGTSKPVDMGFGGFAHMRDRLPYCKARRSYRPRDLDKITALYKSHIEQRTAIPSRSWADLRNLQWLDTEDPTVGWPEYRRHIVDLRSSIDLHRRRINDIYERHIEEKVHLGSIYNGWRFQVRLPEREIVLKEIFDAGYFASSHYFPSSKLFSEDNSPSPVATALADDVLNLFNDSNVDPKGAEAVARIVASHLDRKRSLA